MKNNNTGPRTLVASLTALVMLLVSSCHPTVYEDLSKCPQGVDFSFYVQTPCQNTPTYPSEIKEARIFAFDEAGVLVRDLSAKGLQLSADYFYRTDYFRVGTSDFLVWAGADLSQLDFGAFTPGKTTRGEMIVALRRQAESFSGSIAPIYVGAPVEGSLTQVERTHLGTIYDPVRIHLTQITNTIRFTLTGLDPEHGYSIRLEDDNSRYTVEGTFAPDSRFGYLPEDLKQIDRTVTASMDVMRLATGRRAMLVVTDTTDGKEIMRKNLIEELLLVPAPNAGERTYSLECDHDFDVKIDFDLDLDRGTYVAARATINDWNVVFRKVILK